MRSTVQEESKLKSILNLKIDHANKSVSVKLSKWLKKDSTPTLKEFNQAFGDEGMALLTMILISPSALPVPTGGITHILQIAVLIIAAQALVGRDHLWIPEKMGGIKIDGPIKTKVMPTLVKFLKKAESKSGKAKFKSDNIGKLNLIGSLLIIIFTFGAFFAPPFSMLDTLPSIAIIIISLSLINHSKRSFSTGLVIGSCGLILEIFFSATVIALIKTITEKLF